MCYYYKSCPTPVKVSKRNNKYQNCEEIIHGQQKIKNDLLLNYYT